MWAISLKGIRTTKPSCGKCGTRPTASSSLQARQTRNDYPREVMMESILLYLDTVLRNSREPGPEVR